MCKEPEDVVLARVLRVVEEVLGKARGSVGIEMQAGDVEAWDSFGHVRIVLALEAEFGVSFTMAEIERSASIAALVDVVEAAEARCATTTPEVQ